MPEYTFILYFYDGTTSNGLITAKTRLHAEIELEWIYGHIATEIRVFNI